VSREGEPGVENFDANSFAEDDAPEELKCGGSGSWCRLLVTPAEGPEAPGPDRRTLRSSPHCRSSTPRSCAVRSSFTHESMTGLAMVCTHRCEYVSQH
jgi:hypothetical protein